MVTLGKYNYPVLVACQGQAKNLQFKTDRCDKIRDNNVIAIISANQNDTSVKNQNDNNNGNINFT